MAIYQLKTFADLYTAVFEEIKLNPSDTATLNRIKRDINTVYLNEVVPYEQWKWLRGYQDLVHEAYYPAGSSTVTASVTQDSNLVTLSVAPATARTGQWFAIDGYNEIYRIQSHTASSVNVVLDVPFTGSTSSTATFKIWTDKIPLPVGLRDTVEVTQNFKDEPLEGLGLQQFRRYVASAPKAEGRPSFYSTSDFVDPTIYQTIATLPALSTRASSGVTKTLVFATSIASLLSAGDRIRVSGCSDYTYNGEFVVGTVSTTTLTYTALIPLAESATADLTLLVELQASEMDVERYKELWVYPSIYTSRTTLHVDFIQDAKPLEDATDEPLMPIGDRTVLLYGALMRAWSRERNPEEAQRNQALYERKLMKMAGKVDDSTDLPILKVGRTYLAGKRNASRFRQNRFSGFPGSGISGGGSTSSSATITNTANQVAVFNSLGELDADSNISTTELGYLNNVSSNIQTQLDALTTLNNAYIYVGNASNQATEVAVTGDVVMNNTGVTDISAGVILNADINAAANITRSKMALGTADHVIINDASGVLSSEAKLAVARGGTNLSSYTTGDLPYASSSSVIAKLAIGTTGQALKVVGGLPAWGTLAEVGGGTNQTTYSTGDFLYASGANTLAKLAIGSSGQKLQVSGGVPAWGASSGTLATIAKVFADSPVTILNTIDAYTFDTTGGAISVTLPDCATNSGKTFYLKKISNDFTAVTINRAGADTIQGASSATTSTTLDTQGEEIMLTSFGSTVWQIIQRRIPSAWIAYTPTCTLTTNATPTGFWRRVGGSIEGAVNVAISGGTNSQNVACTFTIPNSSAWTIDTAQLPNSTANVGSLGQGIVTDGTTIFPAVVAYSTTTIVAVRVQDASATYLKSVAINPSTPAPVSLVTGSSINATFRVPITGLNG